MNVSKWFLIMCALTVTACGQSMDSSLEVDQDEHVLNPEQEEAVFGGVNGKTTDFRFTQTTWRECSDPITGNYTGYNCAETRGISLILKSFMDRHILRCANVGLAATGGGTAVDMHVVHAGIAGDPNHSPKSLHAERRAIDIKSLTLKLSTGISKSVIYAGTANRSFYLAFRNCWAETVHVYNGCPYQSVKYKTGSIGWEDANHQYHLHTSVPYCVNGAYGTGYYQR